MYTKLQTGKRRMALAIVLGVFSIFNSFGQVGDAAVTAAVAANAVAIGGELSSINNIQAATLGQNTIISGLLSDIHDYEQKMYNYMSQAQDVVTSAYTIVRCLKLGTDIINELNECQQEARNHPEGLLVSSLVSDQYSDVLQESAALVSYMTPIVKGSGDKNLLNSAERIHILNSVSSRLYNLYSAINRMKQNIMRMRWSHLAREISPELYYQFLNTKSSYDITSSYIKAAANDI